MAASNLMASIFGEYNRKWLIVPLPPAVEWGTFVKVHREQTSPSTCCTQLTWYPFDNVRVIFNYEPASKVPKFQCISIILTHLSQSEFFIIHIFVRIKVTFHVLTNHIRCSSSLAEIPIVKLMVTGNNALIIQKKLM